MSPAHAAAADDGEAGVTLWLVRAGKAGEKEHVAIRNKAAIIGWEALPDLSCCLDREDLLTLLREAYPAERRKTLTSWQHQIWPIRDTMQVGDLVALPLKSRPMIAFGNVSGTYRHRTDLPGGAQHTRPVEWLAQVPRSEFDPDMLFSFGAFMTVCRIARNDAEPRIRAILKQDQWPAADAIGVPPGPAALPAEPPPASRPILANLRPALDSPVPLSLDALEARSNSAIRDRIAQRFKGHNLAVLVGALLEIKGMRVRISPPGVDGGVDVLAGSGPLGLDPPRVVVQVKSGDTKVDVHVLRELSGVMGRFEADQGLLVGWGGFSHAVRTEAASDYFRVRLWSADDLIRAIEDDYDRLPPDIRTEIPLKRIWTLSPDPRERAA